MHYKNGRAAQVGDKVIGRDCGGSIVSGIVIKAVPGTNTCNLGLVSDQNPTFWATASECLHFEDALPLPLPVPDPAPAPPQPTQQAI